MVAGVLAAHTNNGKGISSIGYNCRIAKTSTNKNDLLRMAQDGVKVINISQDWGAANEVDSLLIAELVEDYGVTIVAAAGNENCAKYTYPASYENVISVTSVGHEFARGTTCNGRQFDWKDCHKKYINVPENEYCTHAHNNKVDLCAPGYNIATACHPASYVNGLKEPTGQLFALVDGSSFASPIVAGVCALMLSINPELNPAEIRSILQETAANIDTIPQNAEFAGELGAGRIDAYAAVKKAGTKQLSGELASAGITAGYGFMLKNVAVNKNSTVILKARKQIEILEDFEVSSGSTFSVEIDPQARTN
jgi:subtilisin family serine protease